jgi:hypothetical protein
MVRKTSSANPAMSASNFFITAARLPSMTALGSSRLVVQASDAVVEIFS